MDTYELLLAILGLAVLGSAVLPRLVHGRPISVPIVYVAAGMALFALPLDLQAPLPGTGADTETNWAERLTEFVVIVSLMGAGLKLRRPLGWRTWGTTWRLLGITMPLTIAGIALLGGLAAGLPLAAAILLGAVLAPTDPVLASDVQVQGVQGPEEEDADDEVRFGLTSEAGLNDALAFPFTNLAIAVAAGGSWFAGWVVDDVVVRLTVGLVVGWALGRGIAYLAFRVGSPLALARTGQGFVSVGATLLVYGVAEVAHGYGFLAVFVAAVTLRRYELDHEYHGVLHDFAETLERLASIVFLLLLGGSAVDGALAAISPAGVAVALGAILLVRPAAGWLGMLGSPADRPTRAALAFFGIRGMGTVYYLAHAVTEEAFPDAAEVWAIAILTILLSIVIHGTTASVALAGVERREQGRAAGGAPDLGAAPGGRGARGGR
ncbi:MAG: cation:proton antiporter [Acidimicrobiales bacterium]|nr:cation:proton antiporter [Acidimicrobiales bacterium]